MRVRVAALSVAAASLCGAVQAGAQDPAAFYEENCAACHTIGGGPQVGPDLKGVSTRRTRDWLIRFLLDPAAFESDPEVVRMVKEADGLMMPPTEGMTREMAEALLTLIEQRSGGVQEPAPPPEDPAATAMEIERGRALFTGASRLSASGPPCAACHDAALPTPGGGRLAPDLSGVHGRLGGRTGLTTWLAATPTPHMRALYRQAPLTNEEARALAAFLESPDTGASRPSPVVLLAALGLGGCVLVILGAAFAWRGRFTAVRHPLVARARNP